MSRHRSTYLAVNLARPSEDDLHQILRALRQDPVDARTLSSMLDARTRPPSLETVGAGFAARLRDILRRGDEAREAERCRRAGYEIVDAADEDYPEELFDLPGPPATLILRGRGEWPPAPGITVVGARRSTALGRSFAHEIAEAAGRRGAGVVSGLALGVDQAAHEGALQAATNVQAVLACGVDQIYPPGAEDLARRIEEHGRIVSEMPLGTPPYRGHFPRRNRILAALTPATLVIEADRRSGSLITARIAAEIGREVYAVPGSLDRATSRGTNRLLRDGASPLLGVEDLDWITRHVPTDRARPGPAAARDEVLEALSLPRSLRALSELTGLSPGDLELRLADWEADGQVEMMGGGLYRRRP